MKKKLNEDQVRNELRGGSAFFPKSLSEDSESPSVTEPVQPGAPAINQEAATSSFIAEAIADETKTPETIPVRPYASPDVRPVGRSSVRTPSRVIRRHPFEFYQDQLESLKRLSLEAQLAGENGSMSEMVREAVDQYLRERELRLQQSQGRGEPVRPSGSTNERPSD